MQPKVTLFTAIGIDGRAGWELDDFPSLMNNYALLFGLRTDAVLLDGESIHAMGHHEQNPEMIKMAVPPVIEVPGKETAGHPRPLLVVVNNTSRNYNWRFLQQQPWFRHILVICNAETCPTYLSYLKMRGVSYRLSGSGEVELEQTLETLYHDFNIQTLASVCSGPMANSLQALGRVDAVKIVIAPGVLADRCNKDLPGISKHLYPVELTNCCIAGSEAMLMHFKPKITAELSESQMLP